MYRLNSPRKKIVHSWCENWSCPSSTVGFQTAGQRSYSLMPVISELSPVNPISSSPRC